MGLVNVPHASLGWGQLLKPQLMLYQAVSLAFIVCSIMKQELLEGGAKKDQEGNEIGASSCAVCNNNGQDCIYYLLSGGSAAAL